MQTQDEGETQWANRFRLMDVLQVEPKWQFACERVLDDALHAYVVETFDVIWADKSIGAHRGEQIVSLRKSNTKASLRPRLIDKIRGNVPVTVHQLDHIYTAEHFDEALNWLPDLVEHESIITLDGLWIGKGWVKFVRYKEHDEVGFLARQQKIANLSLVVSELQQKIDVLKEERDLGHQQLQKNVQGHEIHQRDAQTNNEAVRANNAALSTQEQAIIHAKKQTSVLASEAEELQFFIEELATKQEHVKEKLSTLEEQSAHYTRLQEQGLNEKQTWQTTLVSQEKLVAEARLQVHQAELECDREYNKIQQIEGRIFREQERLDVLQERLEQVTLLCLQAEQPEGGLKEQQDQRLHEYSGIEVQLTSAKEQVAQLKTDLEAWDKNSFNADLEAKRLQEVIAQARIEEQALAVRSSSMQESLGELDLEAKAVLEKIPPDITQSIREDELIILSEKIKRLGAINLAAIEEYTSEQQRKMYLDEQHQDLSDALATLETAIEKMDRETRTRLENTFHEINTLFKALFPRLFGGGKAQLELTCDNLLETGIVVMAQPPGKRNSTIHLLSGGEKAMTAVALVFAIFQLNPSPFCMLDEVDAPLDDVNVGRFCALVKEMSHCVQFLFITHNKVTMELADHLIGVTMREPGVSRLVAVDVTQALAME